MRKHLTNNERESRQRAEGELTRRTRVTLKMPGWLSEEAQKTWKGLRRQLKGMELLDNLDAEMLGIYCDAIAKYRKVSKRIDQGSKLVGEDGEPQMVTDETIKEAQAWARVVASYADKLGLSPSARARLAKKRAESAPVDPMEALLNDVRDFVNDDQGHGR